MSYVEVIGYVASALIAVSLMMGSAVRLRVINLAGSAIFVVYGILIGAMPVALMNLIITCVNGFYVFRYLNRKEFFSLLRLNSDSMYLKYFIHYYGRDIEKIFPGYSYRITKKTRVICMLRNTVPCGLFLYEERRSGIYFVALDYVIPRYRDMKSGRFLFESSVDFFRNNGCREFHTPLYGKNHLKYLKKMKFTYLKTEKGVRIYRRAIDAK